MLALLLVAGCYDAPQPACGFRCGPDGSCPSDYTCGADNRCRRSDAPETSCVTTDALPSPRVVARSPESGETVDPSGMVLVTFDVPVVNVTPETFSVRTADGTFPDATVTYDPSTRSAAYRVPSGFPQQTFLTVELSSEIHSLLGDQPLEPTTWQFRTGPDTKRPFVLSTVPTTGTTNTTVVQDLRVQFSEPVVNVNTSTFTVAGVDGTVGYDPPTRTARFDATDQLQANTTYVATLAIAIADLAGNPLNGPVQITFTTGADAVIPSVRTTSPAGGASGVSPGTVITVTFDEPVLGVDTTSFLVNGGAITGTVTMSNGNRVATFDPDANLPSASAITVDLTTAIHDAANNAFAGLDIVFGTN